MFPGFSPQTGWGRRVPVSHCCSERREGGREVLGATPEYHGKMMASPKDLQQCSFHSPFLRKPLQNVSMRTRGNQENGRLVLWKCGLREDGVSRRLLPGYGWTARLEKNGLMFHKSLLLGKEKRFRQKRQLIVT